MPFRTLIATAVDGIIVIDVEGRIQVYNAACERLFGYSAGEAVGKNVKMLMPPPYREKHDAYLAHHRLTGHKGIIGIGREVVGLRKDGTTFPIYLSVGEGSADGRTFYVGIVHDLTERKRWEAALIEREARLKSMLDAGLRMPPTATAAIDQQRQAERRLRLIAEVGEVLATTLDFEDTLTNIAQLVVANLADLCIINFIDDDGATRRARVFCRDAAMAWVCEALMRMPPGREQVRIAQSVFVLGKPALIADVTPDLVRSWAANDEHLAAL